MHNKRSAHGNIESGLPGAQPRPGSAEGAAALCRRPRRAAASLCRCRIGVARAQPWPGVCYYEIAAPPSAARTGRYDITAEKRTTNEPERTRLPQVTG